MNNIYENEENVRAAVQNGGHRDLVGGMWDKIGTLQFDWLVARGLQPNHKLLDIGCGAGRLAVKAVPYLDPYNYFGQDISVSLIEAARGEIAAGGWADRIGSGSFLASNIFDAPGAGTFNYAMAQSVFTHLPIAQWGLCLDKIRTRLAVGAKLYTTFFVAPSNTAKIRHSPGGIITYSDKDPFHFAVEQITEQATLRRWTARHIGDWRHPRDQQMFEFMPPT